jgi:hypothetical protein
MWIIQEPKKVALWNKRHIEEENGECAACLKYSVLIFVEKTYKMQHLEGSGMPVLYIGRTVLKGEDEWSCVSTPMSLRHGDRRLYHSATRVVAFSMSTMNGLFFRRLTLRMITLYQSVFRLSRIVHFTNLVSSIDVYCSEKLISVRQWKGSSGGGFVWDWHSDLVKSNCLEIPAPERPLLKTSWSAIETKWVER